MTTCIAGESEGISWPDSTHGGKRLPPAPLPFTYDRIGGYQAGFSRPVWSLRLVPDQCGRINALEAIMQALRAAQFEYENRMPPEVSETPQELAERHWIEEGIDQLMRGADYMFQRRMRPKQGVTQERFAEAVDEFAMGQLGLQGASKSVLGRLVLAAHFKIGSEARNAADELMAVPNTDTVLREIARTLLQPLVKDGLVAQAEDEL